MKNTVARGLASMSLVIFLFSAVQAQTEHFSLTIDGNEMMPALCDGDGVSVRICTNGTLIKSCSSTDPSSGDIIAYCAGAVIPHPHSMFKLGRVMNKYLSDGRWFFKTKMDNLAKPDPWTVPEYALFGVVEEVTYRSDPSRTPSARETSLQNKSLAYGVYPEPALPDMIPGIKLATGMFIGVVLGLTIEQFSKPEC